MLFLSSLVHAIYFPRSLTGNPCIPNPCNNGGTCLLGEEGNYVCRCPTAFAGASCEGKSHLRACQRKCADVFRKTKNFSRILDLEEQKR